MNTKNIATLAANMRNAFIERKGATIGGGKFTPEELRDGAIALRTLPDVLEALIQLEAYCSTFSHSDIGHKKLAIARSAITKATGE